MLRTTTRLFIWALAGGGAVLAVAAWGGWLFGLVLLVVGAATLAASVARRYVRPLEELAAALPKTPPAPTPAAELLTLVATELRKATERVHEASIQSGRREAGLAHTSDGVLIVQPTGEVEYANPTARLFLQNRVLEVTRRLGQPELERLVAEATLSGQAVAEDVTLWVPGAKPSRARAVPLADGATVLLLSDLSETYRIDRVRRDFVANVSHELKTPVAAIRALAETAATALSSDDLDTATRFVERLGVEAARLAGLVTDLLDLSRVEAAAEFELTEVDLDALLAEAADRARAIAEVKEIELVVHPTGLTVKADSAQLTMAVKNLVDNAVRYSERGKVELGAGQLTEWVGISVADQGIGIPTDEIPRIFERFYRVDKARSRATGGTGLGLAIVRHVAENHGGRVDVESELGSGSTFTLLLPIRSRVVATEGSAA
ncbi:MAG TPA: ATP-binding protein [Actinomycetota bacterium]|nr:ATP-binding protein [Actinomycetota bacterium]